MIQTETPTQKGLIAEAHRRYLQHLHDEAGGDNGVARATLNHIFFVTSFETIGEEEDDQFAGKITSIRLTLSADENGSGAVEGVGVYYQVSGSCEFTSPATMEMRTFASGFGDHLMSVMAEQHIELSQWNNLPKE